MQDLKPSGVGARLGIATAMLAVVVATNRWVSWETGFRLVLPLDEIDYRAIARAAPHLPAHKLAAQHAQRFPFHYLIGLIAHGVGLRVESAYLVATLLAIVLLTGMVALTVAEIGLDLRGFAICLGAFIFNAYSLRYYVLAPGEVADLLFEIGLVTSLLGLLRGRYSLVLAGVAIATLARQTELPAALVTAAWVYAGPGWAAASRPRRLARAACVLASAAGIYLAEVVIAAPFSLADTPDFTHWFLIADLEALPSDAGTLGQHFLRCVNGLLAVTGLLAVAIASTLRDRHGRCSAYIAWTLGLAAAVIVQPVLFSAEFAAHNETRLSVLGLTPCVIALGYALKPMTEQRLLSSRMTVLVLTILAGGSLHHIYTIVGPARASQTVVLQVLAAVALAVVLANAHAQGRRRSSACG